MRSGNYNRFLQAGEPERRRKFLISADWLSSNLETNSQGLRVWNHHFDWECPDTPEGAVVFGAGSGPGTLAARARPQGDRPSEVRKGCLGQAFEAFLATTHQGGVTWIDRAGDVWFEEAIVEPPTHILNGFIWAAWGVHDFFLHTAEPSARRLFDSAVRTLKRNLHRFDCGVLVALRVVGHKTEDACQSVLSPPAPGSTEGYASAHGRGRVRESPGAGPGMRRIRSSGPQRLPANACSSSYAIEMKVLLIHRCSCPRARLAARDTLS